MRCPLVLFAVFMAFESVERLFNPVDIAFNSAILVAILGLIVNGASAFVLGDNHCHHHDQDHDHCSFHHHDHNLRAAYLHVLADALTSLTAIAALVCAKYFGWIWMDPIMGIFGSLLVGSWAFSLIRKSSKTLLDHQAPEHLVHEIEHAIEDDGESRITDLHVWLIAPDVYSVILSILNSGNLDAQAYRNRLANYKFQHITIEVNRFDD
jgi:cation diffusion facilitator family transporter